MVTCKFNLEVKFDFESHLANGSNFQIKLECGHLQVKHVEVAINFESHFAPQLLKEHGNQMKGTMFQDMA